MAEVEDVGDGEKRHISKPMSNLPIDLLQRFISVNHLPLKLEEPSEDADADADVDTDELELSLGLSLNGRFGVDPRAKKIKRSSSIPEFMNQVRDEDMAYVTSMATTPLIRTCSLPTEREEEWRKRKELQTLRRMEARRKRSEKQRNLKTMRERNRGLFEENGADDNYKPAEEGVVRGAEVTLNEFTTRGLPPPPSSSQGSIGSQGTRSSGISDSECQQVQGTNSIDARSPVGANSLPEKQKLPITSGTRIAENSDKIGAVTMTYQSNKIASPANKTKESGGRNLLENMPSVSTKGDGPNGKRIEGFLYKYRKGEEVRIVCVCHGSFLTPAEFVKHAGGGDVAHPLKHIVVNPSML